MVLSGMISGAAWAAEGVAVSTGKSKLTSSNEIRVTVPGRLKLVFCDGSRVEGSPEDTGISGFYDLKNDPGEKYNYAATWSGFFSHKISVEPVRAGKKGAIMPGPGTVELLEASPVRAAVRYAWGARAYGVTSNPVNPDVRFEQTFVVYAPDKLYQTLAFVGIGEEVKVSFVTLVLHTSHARFAGGKSGKGGVYSIKAPWTSLRDEENPPLWAKRFGKSCLLHVAKPGVVTHGDGTQSHHKMNFLFALHKATGTYFYRGDLWVGFRSSIRIRELPTLVKGQRLEYHMLVLANHDMTDLEKAKPYVKEYREPGTPKCAKGQPVGDGFKEAMGCYELEADKGGVEFELPAACHWPAFQVSGWTGGAPKTIGIDGKQAGRGDDYLAGAAKGRLLLQIRRDVAQGTRIVITPDGSPEDKGFFSTAAAELR